MKKAFTIDGDEHEEGNPECSGCFCRNTKRCKCGGLIHVQFLDEDYDGDVHLQFKCDKCGDDYEEE